MEATEKTNTRCKGVVKWFSSSKGYGFIEAEDLGDVFVHFSAIRHSGYKNLRQGERVKMELVDSEKGLQASKVWTKSRKRKESANDKPRTEQDCPSDND